MRKVNKAIERSFDATTIINNKCMEIKVFVQLLLRHFVDCRVVRTAQPNE